MVNTLGIIMGLLWVALTTYNFYNPVILFSI